MLEYVNQVVRGVLLPLTMDGAKDIIKRHLKSYDALLDLKRNCSQTNPISTINERKHMLAMKHQFNESASSYLKRLRRQALVCSFVDCKEFENDDALVQVAIAGFNTSIDKYKATFADVIAKYMANRMHFSFA